MKIKLFTIPNLLTLANLFCGSLAVVSALMCGDLKLSFWLIILAAVFDFFDGFAARLLNSTSAIGAELDSLADVISFGLAPSAVLFVMFAELPAFWQWSDAVVGSAQYVVFIVVAFSALRLAKFNVDTTQHAEFCGLPTPANAMFFASLGFLYATGEIVVFKEMLLLSSIIMSFIMISPIRMFALKFDGFGWKSNQLRYIFILLSAILVVVLQYFSIPIVILMYIIISTTRWALQTNRSTGMDCE